MSRVWQSIYSQRAERGSINSHKMIHTGQKPFKCRLCNMALRNTGRHSNRMRVHTVRKVLATGAPFAVIKLVYTSQDHISITLLTAGSCLTGSINKLLIHCVCIHTVCVITVRLCGGFWTAWTTLGTSTQVT